MLPVAISFRRFPTPPVAILDQLRYGEQPVKQLAEPFDMSLPAISQHLRVLCEAGLVIQQRTDGNGSTAPAQTDF